VIIENMALQYPLLFPYIDPDCHLGIRYSSHIESATMNGSDASML
jgi:hypothetical protein